MSGVVFFLRLSVIFRLVTSEKDALKGCCSYQLPNRRQKQREKMHN